MKKTTSAFIAILLAAGLAALSACNSTVPSVQPGEGAASSNSSIPEVSIPEVSIPDESSEEPSDDISITDSSAEESSQGAEESSEAEQSDEESSEPEEPVSIPPEGTPSKLVPVVEFGFGDGDYELGYSKPDKNGKREGPQGMWLNGNEILINDHLNHRLLVYRDGKLIDKVDTSKYPYTFNCAITDEYYYLVDKQGNAAYRVDRKTKKFEAMEIHGPDGDPDWRYHFIHNPKDSTIDIYAYGGNNDRYGEKRNTIIGLKVTPIPEVATWNQLYMPPYQIVDSEEEGWCVWDYDFQLDFDYAITPVNLIRDTDKLKTYDRYVLSEAARTTAIACQHISYKDENGTSYYTIYSKIIKHGVIAGRYITPTWNPIDSEARFKEDPHNFSNFKHIVTDDGDLLVVYGDETHVGIYKVEFGMDKMPIDITD